MSARYLAAAHAIQSAIAYIIGIEDQRGTPHDQRASGPKHLRVGVDTLKAEQAALANLLIAKGIFTLDEYREAITIAVEEEATRYAASARKLGNLPDTVNFG